MSTLRVRVLGAAWLAAFVACGDAGTEVGSPPTDLVPVSASVDTVGTGEATDLPLSVRVQDALGNAIEGTPVRFTVVNGAGTVDPGVAVSGVDGIAETSFAAGTTPGEVTVRAEVPSAPDVSAFDFLLVATAADSVVVRLSEGEGQRAEVGSQLPVPFEVRVETGTGTPAGGIPIVFRLDTGGRSALLTADSVLTDADGTARTLLTLGRQPGTYRVSAFAARGVRSDTAVFEATATATFEGAVVFDSVGGSDELVAGEEAVLHGRGFSPIGGENDVRIEGVSAVVIDATGDRLTVLVPTFAGECLPARDVGVRVLVGDDVSNGAMLPLRPRESPVELEPGAALSLRGREALECIQFAAEGELTEFVVAVTRVDRPGAEPVATRLTTRVGSEAAPAVAATLLPDDLGAGVERESGARQRPDARLRRSALSRLVDGRVAVARPDSETPVRSPSVGDELTLAFAAQPGFTVSCTATGSPITAAVRAVGDQLVLAEDLGSPPGGFEAEDWAGLLADLDQIVAVTDTAYFGAPPDLDANGRVVVLFTPRVNEISAGEPGPVGGFFLPTDLAAAGGSDPSSGGALCDASNEGEIVYVAVPDPEGRVGEALSVEAAALSAGKTTAHELQHLINAAGRILGGEGGFAAVEETWLDEALSAVAEEVSGLALAEQSVRSGLTYDQVTSSRSDAERFDTYHSDNFFNLALFLADPTRAGPDPARDPGGTDAQRTRGFTWLILRWLGDRSGEDERALFRRLVTGGRNRARGVPNVETATGRSWSDLMSGAAAVLALGATGGADGSHRVTTWNMADVFESLAANISYGTAFRDGAAARPRPLAGETAALEFDVGPSTLGFFSVATGPDLPAIALSLSTPTGTRLSETSEPQITIVRIR